MHLLLRKIVDPPLQAIHLRPFESCDMTQSSMLASDQQEESAQSFHLRPNFLRTTGSTQSC